MIFSITCRCINSVNKQDIIKCVKSIKTFHPDTRIVVVDSDSPDKSYFSEVEALGVIIADIKNKNYETGGIWHTFNNYTDDVYVFLQDSMVLNKSLSEYMGSDLRIINFYEGWKDGKPEEKAWSRQQMENTEYEYQESNFKMLQYNSFLASRNTLIKLQAKKLDRILPTEKAHAQAMERIFGMALSQEGLMENALLPANTITKIWRQRK